MRQANTVIGNSTAVKQFEDSFKTDMAVYAGVAKVKRRAANCPLSTAHTGWWPSVANRLTPFCVLRAQERIIILKLSASSRRRLRATGDLVVNWYVKEAATGKKAAQAASDVGTKARCCPVARDVQYGDRKYS